VAQGRIIFGIILDELLKTMVAHDFWFYKVDEQKITANSQSMYWAFEKILRTQAAQ